MGGQVPEPVENALGVRLAELGPKLTDMLNVSRQMDGPFLLSSTGGDAAKILGNLSGITKIDQALSSLRPDISNAKKAIDVSTKLQKNYDASIGEFANLDQEAVHLEQISKALGQAQLVQTRLKSLEDLASRMDSYNEVYSTADTELRHHKHIISLDGSYEEASEIYMKTIELTGILNEMEQYSIALEFLTEQLEEEAVELTQYETRFQEILHEAGYCPTCGGKT
jgi:DNA repair ATPase RecN